MRVLLFCCLYAAGILSLPLQAEPLILRQGGKSDTSARFKPDQQNHFPVNWIASVFDESTIDTDKVEATPTDAKASSGDASSYSYSIAIALLMFVGVLMYAKYSSSGRQKKT